MLLLSLLFSFALAELKVGDPAPTFFVRDLTEQNFFFSDTLKTGKPAVLSFFATWCAPCMKELPLLEEVYQKYLDERIKFFLVDITEATRTIPGNENLPKAGPFLKEKGVTMQILYDTRGTVMKRYNAQTLPRLFLMDGNRKITLTRRGFHDGEEQKFKNDLSVEIERLIAQLPPPKSETK